MTEIKADSIFAAIPRAMSQIKRIAKDSRNAEQKYDFASVDDFLAMTGPILAANGLFITMDEEEVRSFERQGKYGTTHWLSITFIITVWHESGQSLTPAKRTVEVIRTGAQSFGSAQSYALKQFQRALFNIPTGDKDDADYAEKGDGAPVRDPHQVAQSEKGLNAAFYDGVRDALPPNATPAQHAEAITTAIVEDMRSKKSLKGLNAAWDRHKAMIERIAVKFPDLRDQLIDAFENQKNDLEPMAAE